MSLLAGLIKGFTTETDKLRAEATRKAEQQDQRTMGVLSALLQSTNPDLQARALQGLSDMSAGRLSKKGLQGYFGETEPPESLREVAALLSMAPALAQPGAASPTAPPPRQAGAGPTTAYDAPEDLLTPDALPPTRTGVPADVLPASPTAPPPRAAQDDLADLVGPEPAYLPYRGVFEPDVRTTNLALKQGHEEWKALAQRVGTLYTDPKERRQLMADLLRGRNGAAQAQPRARNLDPGVFELADGKTVPGYFDNTAQQGQPAYYTATGEPMTQPFVRFQAAATRTSTGPSLTSTMTVADARAYYGPEAMADLAHMPPDAYVKAQELPDGTVRIVPTTRTDPYQPAQNVVFDAKTGRWVRLDTRGGAATPTEIEAPGDTVDMKWAKGVLQQIADYKRGEASAKLRLPDSPTKQAARVAELSGGFTEQQLNEIASGSMTRAGQPRTSTPVAPGNPGPPPQSGLPGSRTAPPELLKRLKPPAPK